MNHDVNRALYHTGRLPYQMLLYPQFYEPFFDVDDVSGNAALFSKPFDFLLELGRVNDAEHVAMEMLEMRPSGAALKRLALAKMIKGQPANARVVLNVLRDDLVWGQWAERYLQRLAADPDLAGDEEVQRIRAVMLSKDDMSSDHSIPSRREGLLYQPAASLLDSAEAKRREPNGLRISHGDVLRNDDVQAVAELFPFLDGLSYPTTPPLYEEAPAALFGPNTPRRAGRSVPTSSFAVERSARRQ